ncbi:hypothetical protein AJ79_07778 [Helicocarpus griseus UAMH5409]|uniref:Uncharacterized protein n=1 Tax=Helicocarpus griseus UAMH5409 TaxID=1447875 RepID=A0A2B7WZF3_9EURO|nr:hypothetical protein AJ79_07778 [Helicocarpus griseus UAMH5409]
MVLGSLCCCFPSQRRLTSPSPLHQQPHDPQAGFRQHGVSGDIDAPGIDEPYLSMAPLPRYTPRPMSLHEKTLAFERGQSNFNHGQSYLLRDEKNRHECERELAASQRDDHSSDTSSAVSVPSSFGNTSTATTETPPPPYSSNSSIAPSRHSLSLSISTHGTGVTYSSLETPEPQSPASQLRFPPPAAVYRSHPTHHGTETGRDQRRRSSEERRRSQPLPPFPPAYPKRE